MASSYYPSVSPTWHNHHHHQAQRPLQGPIQHHHHSPMSPVSSAPVNRMTVGATGLRPSPMMIMNHTATAVPRSGAAGAGGGSGAVVSFSPPAGSFAEFQRRQTAPPQQQQQQLQRTNTKSPTKNNRARRHRTQSNKNASSPWQRLLCVEEMKDFSQRGRDWFTSPPSSLGPRAAASSRQPRGGYEFRDAGRLVSIDSTEDNWDLAPDYPGNLMPARDGPVRRQADDYEITARDLFPWLATILDNCCCGEKKRPRMIVRARGESVPNGPQLETVCLDCGNVLEHHTMPNGGPVRCHASGLHDMTFPGSTRGGGSSSSDLYQTPLKSHFSGYDNWDVSGTPSAQREAKKNLVPLPAFASGPTRVFQNSPAKAPQMRDTGNDYFTIDKTGRVLLPQFPDDARAQ